MKVKCNLCGKSYDKIFNTILRLDYEIPGRGKVYEWNLCMKCRKYIIGKMNESSV